ncbi:uncharacterized protein DUF3907 [Bacillus oleivorans]|uniref:Uncharacterized protein DUF3907 n=1 Tax=Bacillus oleivorans TaxID=1448271 RepID=A0A285CKK9_9BACI|nr:YpuI family protein [Bacillus oleivorans]SNX68092.1 uncharacterized protein DUF3907 [Bacillus oleivorans]
MAHSLVKIQIQHANSFLEESVARIEQFLNTTTLQSLQGEKDGDLMFYKGIASNLRRLCVFCEESLDTCQLLLNKEDFSKQAAEKTLYRIYHQCIEEFFSPKSDLWYEDSRSAYTGKNSIKFRKSVPLSVEHLMSDLEQPFQKMREELEYYETDYATKITQNK